MSTEDRAPSSSDPAAGGRPKAGRRWVRRAVQGAVALLLVWWLLAYVVLPALWRHYEHHPALATAPKTTVNAQGIPGDPLNVGLVGTAEEIVAAMTGAGWHRPDPITLRSSVHIAESVALDRPYVNAPVSNLFVFGRKQDLAFELPVGRSADQRHHVRFWKSDDRGDDGRPLWLGAATFDHGVGLSHYTGQVTHHIAPDVDADRDRVIGDLVHEGRIAEIYDVTGVGATVNGRNAGDDWYYTDGELTVGVLTPGLTVSQAPPRRLPNPALVRWKNSTWRWIRSWL